MGHYIDQIGNYYEGDKAHWLDQAVSKRPDVTHVWRNGAWELNLEQQLASFISAIQARLDAFAKTRGYANILSAATYANSTTPRFAAEGQYALRIRDETWIRGYALMDEMKAGTRPMPASNEELFALLPKLEWPK